MNFDYTELNDYFLVIFKIDGIPFASIVDKENKSVVDVFTLDSGVHNGSHAYDTNTSLKKIDWLSLGYFEIEEAIYEYFSEH